MKKRATRTRISRRPRSRTGISTGDLNTAAAAAGSAVIPLVHRVVFTALFLFMFALIGMLASGYLTAIIFAGILAGSFHPLLRRMIENWGWPRKWAAPVLCLVIVLSVFLPCVYILVRLTQEVVSVYRLVQSPETEKLLREALFGGGTVSDIGREVFQFIFPDRPYNVEGVQSMVFDFAKRLSGSALSLVNSIVGNMLNFGFQFLIMVLLIYGFFLYGPDLRRFLSQLSPLPSDDEALILRKFNEMNYVTLVCNGIGGIIQGVLAGVAFGIAGVASPLLWSVVMIVMAFIPLVGISFVYVPATLYLLAVGKVWTAISLFVWCSAVAFLTENWFKPMFMGNRVQINSLLVLFSIVGGMTAFGMAGIFYGPLIVFIFLTTADLYNRKYAGREG